MRTDDTIARVMAATDAVKPPAGARMLMAKVDWETRTAVIGVEGWPGYMRLTPDQLEEHAELYQRLARDLRRGHGEQPE